MSDLPVFDGEDFRGHSRLFKGGQTQRHHVIFQPLADALDALSRHAKLSSSHNIMIGSYSAE